jgi:threonine 3-dehydrogenase
LVKNCLVFFLADSWPEVLDDQNARREWQWKPEYDLPNMVSHMVQALAPKYVNAKSTVQTRN